MSDLLTNAQAASLLGIETGTLARIRRRFRHVSERDEQGEIHWRADIIQKSVEFKAALTGPRQKLSTERLLEMAVREVVG